MSNQQTKNQNSNGDPQTNKENRIVSPQQNNVGREVSPQTNKVNKFARPRTNKENKFARPRTNKENIKLNLTMTPEPLFIKNDILNIIDIDYNNLSKKNGCDWCGAPHCDGC